MVKALPYLKLLPPNSLIWRDTLYIEYKDGTAVSISLLSKLAKVIDDYLNGKVSEIVIESDEIDLKMSIQQAKFVANGLIAEYLFWEGTGTILHDSSGNGRHTNINGPVWSQLVNGKYYLHFDGVDDWVGDIYVGLPSQPWSMAFIVVARITDDKTGVIVGTWWTGRAIWYDANVKRICFKHVPYHGFYFKPIDLNKWHFIALNSIYIGDTKWQYRDMLDGTIYEGTVTGDAPGLPGNWTQYVDLGGDVKRNTSYFGGDVAMCWIFDGFLVAEQLNLLYKLAKIVVPELP